MHEAYAQALWQMVEAGRRPKEAVAALRARLAADGREALFPRIARAFMRLTERDARKSGVVLTVAREKDERSAKSAIKSILSELGVDSKDIQVAVDDSLIGGWRLEGKGALVDASFKNQLLSIYNRATK